MRSAGSVHAQSFDTYPTRGEAGARARTLECSGACAMGGQWMPCANEQAQHRDLRNN
nr:DUF3721 domain-containing protein [Synechococcus sp. CCY 9618]